MLNRLYSNRDDSRVAPRDLLSALSAASVTRPRAHGKFLFHGSSKFYVRGVTYGPFRPDAHGGEYHDPATVDRDFAAIAANGFNTIRTYTVPPRWLLGVAATHGLHVMVGLPWEQHVAFLDGDSTVRRSIRDQVRLGARECAGHPAVLCLAIGNEIPASIVRWHGRRRVESFLRDLYNDAKAEDPSQLVTYVNYPTTEYLDLTFLDFICFNVYLETQDRLEAYLARLQNLAGDRPLVLTEVGLDSARNGEFTQARSVSGQVRTAFSAGCAGAVVFSWTDEWHRGGHDIEDWDFGLTTRDRKPKLALDSVRHVLHQVPFPHDVSWPRVTVVVCSYNGSRTIENCLQGVQELCYPDLEVLVVDDGSTDDTAAIASRMGFRVISTPNRGLSSARNTGLEEATGEIVAYLDDDARPDPHWLNYLSWSFLTSDHVGVGGPNIPPPGEGLVAECVASAPGGPAHVLISDTEAEHIPGCNMAFRRSALLEIGGFDRRFRIAGDDVDVCWRLQEGGGTLGFCPAAVVWHHRRSSVSAFWRQQVQYGKAEAMLERKWPERYNGAGQAIWQGRVYGPGGSPLGRLFGAPRIYHGVWGTGAFQTRQPSAIDEWRDLVLAPEWYLPTVIVLVGMAGLWPPLLVGLPFVALAITATAAEAAVASVGSEQRTRQIELTERLLSWLLVTVLHVMQPLARFIGRVSGALTPWRRHGVAHEGSLPPCRVTLWSERWRSEVEWLRALERHAHSVGARTRRGGPHDRWDIEVRDGEFGSVRILLGIEEHGAGRQLLRLRLRPSLALWVGLTALASVALSTVAWLSEAPFLGFLLLGVAGVVAANTVEQWRAARAAIAQMVDRLQGELSLSLQPDAIVHTPTANGQSRAEIVELPVRGRHALEESLQHSEAMWRVKPGHVSTDRSGLG